jgi:hypothetical protein
MGQAAAFEAAAELARHVRRRRPVIIVALAPLGRPASHVDLH